MPKKSADAPTEASTEAPEAAPVEETPETAPEQEGSVQEPPVAPGPGPEDDPGEPAPTSVPDAPLPGADNPEVQEPPAPEPVDDVTADPYDVFDGASDAEAVAGPMGGSDNYPYVDKTKLPLHEHDLPVNTDAGGPSHAELNPALAPNKES